MITFTERSKKVRTKKRPLDLATWRLSVTLTIAVSVDSGDESPIGVL